MRTPGDEWLYTPRMRRLIPILVGAALIAVLTGCGGDEDPPPQANNPPAAETTPEDGIDTATSSDDGPDSLADDATTEEPEVRNVPCEPEGADWLTLEGESPDAFVLGDGTAAVVLLHQSDGRACAWADFAETVAGEGYVVIVPVMEPRTWPQPIISAAVDHVRERGADSVALVGASMGGTYALAAAPDLAPAPDLVVAVSSPDEYHGADAVEAIGELDLPLMFVVAEDETDFVDSTETMAQAADGTEAEVVIRPGRSHGILLLRLDDDAALAVMEALEQHLR